MKNKGGYTKKKRSIAKTSQWSLIITGVFLMVVSRLTYAMFDIDDWFWAMGTEVGGIGLAMFLGGFVWMFFHSKIFVNNT